MAAVIGIKDLKKPDYGPEIKPEPGDVPVFWSCGVTGLEAVKSISEYISRYLPH